jgi:hypothetical protein
MQHFVVSMEKKENELFYDKNVFITLQIFADKNWNSY